MFRIPTIIQGGREFIAKRFEYLKEMSPATGGDTHILVPVNIWNEMIDKLHEQRKNDEVPSFVNEEEHEEPNAIDEALEAYRQNDIRMGREVSDEEINDFYETTRNVVGDSDRRRIEEIIAEGFDPSKACAIARREREYMHEMEEWSGAQFAPERPPLPNRHRSKGTFR